LAYRTPGNLTNFQSKSRIIAKIICHPRKDGIVRKTYHTHLSL
jgi:hypothetical protein